MADLIYSSSERIYIRDTDPDAPDSSAETVQREMQSTLNVRLQSLRQVCAQNADMGVHLVPPESFLNCDFVDAPVRPHCFNELAKYFSIIQSMSALEMGFSK